MAIRPWRMRLPFALPLVLGLWALAPSAGAQVYRWVDPDGSIHYSDSPNSAPKDAKVEVTTGDDITVEGTGRIEAGSPPTNPPLPQTQPAQQPPQQPPPSTGASGDWSGQPPDQPNEQAVRQSFRDTHQKIADAEKQLAQAKKVVEAQDRGTASTNCTGTREECLNWRRQMRATQDQAKERVAEAEAELRKWKNYLDDLERWASSRSIPRAWRE
ncbi:MAG TPA: DUF4124 domain-containing protein [Myxococcaceae bacterium]|nr:DUF4124 domain-containing protein [Myxococcaceae bacterium]